MTVLQPIRNLWLTVVAVLLLGCTFGQNADDRTGQIASALQNKEFDHALDLLRPALKKSPGNAQFWAMQGVAYAGQGHKKEALTSFQNALKISPDYLPALHGAIQIDFENSSPAAIPLLQRVLRSASWRYDQSCHAGSARVPAGELCGRSRPF